MAGLPAYRSMVACEVHRLSMIYACSRFHCYVTHTISTLFCSENDKTISGRVDFAQLTCEFDDQAFLLDLNDDVIVCTVQPPLVLQLPDGCIRRRPNLVSRTDRGTCTLNVLILFGREHLAQWQHMKGAVDPWCRTRNLTLN